MQIKQDYSNEKGAKKMPFKAGQGLARDTSEGQVIERKLYGWTQIKRNYVPEELRDKCYIDNKPVFINDKTSDLVNKEGYPYVWDVSEIDYQNFLGILPAPEGITGIFKVCPLCEEEFFIGLKVPGVAMSPKLVEALEEKYCPDCRDNSSKLVPDDDEDEEGDENEEGDD
jgi:hypothetical protein